MKRLLVITLFLCSSSFLRSEELANGAIELLTTSFRRISIFEDGSVTTCADSQGKFTFYKAAGSVDYEQLRTQIEQRLARDAAGNSTTQTMVAIKGNAYASVPDDAFLRKLFKNDPKEWNQLVDSTGESTKAQKLSNFSQIKPWCISCGIRFFGAALVPEGASEK